jgi:hypothetical protein
MRLLLLAACLLSGCASYKQTLTDSAGHTTNCEASGKSGIITGVYLRHGFDDCVNAAKAAGYH